MSILLEDYERYDFLDLEQRECLASAELYDLSEILKNQKQMEGELFKVI